MKERPPDIAFVGTLKIVRRPEIISIRRRELDQISIRPDGLLRAGVTAVRINRLEEAGIRRLGPKTLQPSTIGALTNKVTGGQCARAVGILGLQHCGNVAVGRVEHAIAFAVWCIEAREETHVLCETGVDMLRR